MNEQSHVSLFSLGRLAVTTQAKLTRPVCSGLDSGRSFRLVRLTDRSCNMSISVLRVRQTSALQTGLGRSWVDQPEHLVLRQVKTRLGKVFLPTGGNTTSCSILSRFR